MPELRTSPCLHPGSRAGDSRLIVQKARLVYKVLPAGTQTVHISGRIVVAPAGQRGTTAWHDSGARHSKHMVSLSDPPHARHISRAGQQGERMHRERLKRAAGPAAAGLGLAPCDASAGVAAGPGAYPAPQLKM